MPESPRRASRFGGWDFLRLRSALPRPLAEALRERDDAQRGQPRHRDGATDRVVPAHAELLRRDLEGPILDCWYREYFLGCYRTGLLNKPAREAVGVVVSTLEELACFFAAPAAAQNPAPGGADPPPADEVERRRRLQAVLARDQQAGFRTAALRHFHGRCVVSGCDVPQALEAAHIIPVSVGGPDRIENALLLRTDLHQHL